jgi:hypothetical protein
MTLLKNTRVVLDTLLGTVATVRDANYFDKEQRCRCPFHSKIQHLSRRREIVSRRIQGHAMANYILLGPNTQIGRPVNEINTWIGRMKYLVLAQ